MAKFMYVPGTPRSTTDGFLRNPAEGWKDYTARYKNDGLRDVAAQDRLYIVGHGTFAGTTLNTLSPGALLEALQAENLNRNHVHFHMFSCYSGVKMPGSDMCFAKAFAHAIRDYYRDAKVYGYLGAVQFDRVNNRKTVSKSASWGNTGAHYNEVERAKDNKVSFSINRAFMGSNSVVADQDRKYIATVGKHEEVCSSIFGDSIITKTKVVVY